MRAGVDPAGAGVWVGDNKGTDCAVRTAQPSPMSSKIEDLIR